MHWKTHDSGVQVKVANGAVISSTVGAVETNGNVLDREYTTSSVGEQGIFRSAKVAVLYDSAGSSGSIVWNLQHSSSTASGWADYDDKDGSTGQSVAIGTSEAGVDAATFDLAGAKRYVRVQVTPVTATGVSAAVVFGGGEYVETE